MREIDEFIAESPAINTHCHHYRNDFFSEFDLDKLLRSTYVNWCGVPFDETDGSKNKYLEKVKFNSYFVWLQKSLKEIYGIKENLSIDNWSMYTNRIKEAHSDQDWHKKILDVFCHYERIILDTRWDPGSNNEEPELFASTFRVDPLFFGFDQNYFDHDGNNAYKFYKNNSEDLDSYLVFVKDLIVKKIESGCVSLKCAIAYDRTLYFADVSKEDAGKIFHEKNINKENIEKFQDYLFHFFCDIAAELEVPLQCHTGLACLNGTNAINLLNAIKQHPNTKFVLFHGSYPWSDDLLGLLHVFPNVYADICWLPIISPSAAEHVLHQLIEVGTADKICWGCDTWTSEESFGARMAINSVLRNVLTKKIYEKYLNISEAKLIVNNILKTNAKVLYGI